MATGYEVTWTCDEDGCPANVDHYVKIWSAADKAARRHHIRTLHKTLVLKQIMRSYP